MATNTAPSFTEHTAPSSGSTAGPYNISFSYIDEDEVDVTVDGVLKTKTTHYTFASADTIQFTSGNNPANSAAIKFQRDTNIGAKKVDFQDGSVLTETDLDSSTDQLLFGLQELSDDYVKRDGSQTVTGNLVFEGSADDNNETTLAVTNPTADRTITLPDTTGTVVTTGDSGTVTSTMINDGTIVNADINASAAIDGTKISPNFGSQNIVTSGTVDGRDVSTDGTKLDTIETNATQDQTDAEIRTAVENANDSNVFTDADHAKLNAIEDNATRDQTAAEIRTLVGDATDSNVFTDAEKTKLSGIESGATQDQTGAEIKSAYEAESNTNAFTDTEKSKLAAIEASADVTDATNVDAAGAVMNSDLGTKGQILVGDGAGDPTALPVGTNNYVLVADSNEATGVKWATVPAGSGMSNLVEDTSPQLGGNLDVQASEINTSTTNGNIKLNPNGTGVVEVKGDGSSADGTLQLNCSQNSHGVKIKSPAHSAGASYTLTLPVNVVNGQFLKTDTNGNLSWAAVSDQSLQAPNGQTRILVDNTDINIGYAPLKFDTDSSNTFSIKIQGPTTLTKDSSFTLPEDGTNGQFLKTNGSGVLSFGTVDLTALSASNLTSGTIPDARFPATLPAASATNLTAIPAANITGTLPAISAANLTNIPAANITGTLPAISATNLTNIPAANITGTLPAIDGSNLTGITAGAQGGGGESIFFESEIAMDNDYTISSNHNALVAGPLTINATLTINSPSVVTIP